MRHVTRAVACLTPTVLHVAPPLASRDTPFGAQIFPGLDVHFTTLVMHFRCPFVRDYILLHGMLDCSRATCKRVLTGCARLGLPSLARTPDVLLLYFPASLWSPI